MNSFRIPLSNAPSQEFSITLSGALYFINIRLNYRMQTWTLNLYDSDRQPLLYGIALVPGVDVLTPYNITNLGLLFAINLESPLEEIPTDDNFSDYGGLFYVQTV